MDPEILNRLYLKSLNLISYSPKTVNEVKEKIEKYLFKEDIPLVEKENYIEAVIELLTDQGFLNDEKLALDIVELNQLSRKSKSRTQLRQKMYKKRFSEDLITKALDSISSDYEEKIARDILNKKFKNLEYVGLTSSEQHVVFQKAIKYLMTKGFTFEVSKRAVDIHFDVK